MNLGDEKSVRPTPAEPSETSKNDWEARDDCDRRLTKMFSRTSGRHPVEAIYDFLARLPGLVVTGFMPLRTAEVLLKILDMMLRTLPHVESGPSRSPKRSRSTPLQSGHVSNLKQ